MMIKNDYKYTKKKTKIGGKGFYIALGCCLLAVGLGVWGAVQGRAPVTQGLSGANSQIEARTTKAPVQTKEAPANVPATGVADERGTQQEQTTAATERETQAEYFMLPLGTKINKDFSNGEW